EPSAEQQDEEVLSDGELESESQGIFLDPSQASILPDILPGESDASQLAPGNNKEKKKRPVLQLTDVDTADDGDESGEDSDGDDIDDDDDPALRRATPNKKQVRDEQDELGTYSSPYLHLLVFSLCFDRFSDELVPGSAISFDVRAQIFQDVILRPDLFFFE